MRMILYSLIFITLWLFTNSYPQEILYAGHEIIIYTEGSNPGHNTVKFWLDAVGTVWDQDYNHSQQSLQNIITTLDFAHAYNYFNTVEDDIPIPYSNQTSAWG